MAPRIYHQEHERLFQRIEGGSFYTFVGGKEKSLDTADIKTALRHLDFMTESVSFFGAAAFNKRVGDVFPYFLAKKKKEVSKETYGTYEEIAEIFERAGLYKLSLAKMNQKAWLKFCEFKGHSIKDFQNHRNLMRQFLKWCVMQDYLRAMVPLQNPKHSRRLRKVIPPAHAIKIFTEAKKSRGGILLYLVLLAFHGPRGNEMRKLKRVNVDLDQYLARLEKETVKTREAREIPLNPIAVELFKIHFNKLTSDGIRSKWVFPNAVDSKRHMSDSGFKTAWATCIRNAELESFGYTMHDWRSTYEKWLEMSAMNETQKDKATGASREVRLKTYVRNLTADDLRGAEKVVNIPELIELLQNPTVSLKPDAGFQLETKKAIEGKDV